MYVWILVLAVKTTRRTNGFIYSDGMFLLAYEVFVKKEVRDRERERERERETSFVCLLLQKLAFLSENDTHSTSLFLLSSLHRQHPG